MESKYISKDGQFSLGIITAAENLLNNPTQYPLYTIILVPEGAGEYKADFGSFEFKGPSLFFSTPLQTLSLRGAIENITMLQFHGDYYCIEYHKQEVACNGVLFNNIYTEPIISLTRDEYNRFARIIHDLDHELLASEPADVVLTAYLQLLLAKATSIKNKMNAGRALIERDDLMENLKSLIEENFTTMRKPAEYANVLHISPDTLSKRCKQYFKKTPTALIHERIVLEAKKGLHLTRKSIKEIAYSLKFQDEHYFSRFFKKVAKVTPLAFRAKTGISIVTNSSTSNPE